MEMYGVRFLDYSNHSIRDKTVAHELSDQNWNNFFSNYSDLSCSDEVIGNNLLDAHVVQNFSDFSLRPGVFFQRRSARKTLYNYDLKIDREKNIITTREIYHSVNY